jgi:hypothetical protein
MTRLLTVTCKRQLPGVFSHQLLKSLQRHNFPERRMNRFGAGFHPENFSGFVRQIGIQPYRCHCHSHCVLSQSNISIYICSTPFVKLRPDKAVGCSPGAKCQTECRPVEPPDTSEAIRGIRRGGQRHQSGCRMGPGKHTEILRLILTRTSL